MIEVRGSKLDDQGSRIQISMTFVRYDRYSTESGKQGKTIYKLMIETFYYYNPHLLMQELTSPIYKLRF
jgi:hypothetical protein